MAAQFVTKYFTFFFLIIFCYSTSTYQSLSYNVWSKRLYWKASATKLCCWSWPWCYWFYYTIGYRSSKRVGRRNVCTSQIYNKAVVTINLLIYLSLAILQKYRLRKEKKTMNAIRILIMRLVCFLQHHTKRTMKKQIEFGI
jgi:hypothetical protein